MHANTLIDRGDGVAPPEVPLRIAEERRPHRIVLAGAGFIANYHAEVVQELRDCDVVGACDPDPERLRELCERWNIRYQAGCLADLLETCPADAVHVLTPPSTHVEMAEQALNAGLHVLIEKPMALTSRDADRVFDLAWQRGRLVGVNHNAVHQPAFRELLSRLRQGGLGRIEHVIAMQNVPLGQLKSGRHDHWMFRDPRNLLFEQGPHPFSQVCELLGDVQRASTLVAGERTLRSGHRFYTKWQISLDCAEGTAQVFLAFDGTLPQWFLHVVGQDGSAHLDFVHNTCTVDRATGGIAAADALARGLSTSWRLATQSLANFVRYGQATLGLSGQRDAYYLSMKGGIGEFHASVRSLRPSPSASSVRQVTAALELAAASLPIHRVVPAVPAPRSSRRDGEVLVLGSTGFIGGHLVRALSRAEYPLRIMVRRPSALPADLLRDDPTVIVGDVLKREQVDCAVAGCRSVIHLVAGAPTGWPAYQRLFVDSTRMVAEACLAHGVEQLQYVSSIAAHYLGKPNTIVGNGAAIDDRPLERCHYARAKIVAEQMLMDLHRTRDLPVVIFRPGIVIGSGGPVEHLGVGYWPDAANCITWGTREHPLPLVLVDDVVDAMVKALGKPGLRGSAFDLVGDVRLTAREYIEAVSAATRRDIRLHRRSVIGWRAFEFVGWAVKAVGRRRDNVALSWRELSYRTAASQFDCTRTKATLEWQPVQERERFIELGVNQALQQEFS
jgi:predicted dehydrogenase/nucleoside-diphosphate-sugar epimerase